MNCLGENFRNKEREWIMTDRKETAGLQQVQNKERFIRTERLLGSESMKTFKEASVAVFGIGGVGGYAAEALARAGIGSLALFDKDVVDITNINRQIIALDSTVGRLKVEVMRERIKDINPEAIVNAYPVFYLPENAGEYDLSGYDYIIDAVDTVTAKLELIVRAKAAGTRIISCMGAGNKLNPAAFEIEELEKTSVCPLAKVMRRELRARGITNLKVLYSKEVQRKPANAGETVLAGEKKTGKISPGSISFVPSVAGLMIAGEVLRELCGESL